MQWLKTKTIEQALADSDEPGRQLQRTLGVFDLMILGLAVAVGAGIFSVGARAALTIPRPVSPLAHRLKDLLVKQIPVVFTLDRDDTGKHTLQLNKYLGQATLPPPIPFIITRGAGLLRAPKKIPEDVPAPPPRAKPDAAPIRFSSAIRT